MRPRFGVATAIAVVLCALWLPAMALAGNDPTGAQYEDTVTQVSNAAEQAPSQSTQSGGGLPVTGSDVIALAAVALSLGGAGFALRRLASRESRS
jgi:hypothetical protein